MRALPAGSQQQLRQEFPKLVQDPKAELECKR